MIGLIISGLPASGKGTQCKMVASQYDLVHLDTGENLRREMQQQTPLGMEARKFISLGRLVPDNLIREIEIKMIDKFPSARGFLFDGFPRTIGQAEILEGFNKEYGITVKAFILLEVEQKEIIERIHKRAIEGNRKDDQDINIIMKRIEQQSAELNALIGFYSQRNKYFKVDGNGDMKQVFESIKTIIDKHHLTEV